MKTNLLKWIAGVTGVIVLSYVVIKYFLPMFIGILIFVGVLTVGMVIHSVLKSKGKGGVL